MVPETNATEDDRGGCVFVVTLLQPAFHGRDHLKVRGVLGGIHDQGLLGLTAGVFILAFTENLGVFLDLCWRDPSSAPQSPGYHGLPNPPHQNPAQQVNQKPSTEDDKSKVMLQCTPSSGIVHAAPESQTRPTMPNSPPEISIHQHVTEMIDVATEVNETDLLRVDIPPVTDRYPPSQKLKVSTSTQTIPYLPWGHIRAPVISGIAQRRP
ncbi:hypothetical protein MTO96_044169 [Rhipicephalus appendiculatus]